MRDVQEAISPAGAATAAGVAVAPACPVCGGASSPAGAIPGWGGWRRCAQCTLEFADPLRREDDSVEWFSKAYRGEVAGNAMTDFRRRVEQRRVILDQLEAPGLWFWTPAFDEVMAWLKATLEPGSTVLDVGCGLGFFLHALRQEGFHAVGLDIADDAVALNRRDGFEVWHGPIETMPEGWQDPDAVVSFFMVHHLEDPASFISAVRSRAPRAQLAIAAYGPTNTGDVASLPPRTLIRWNGRALGRVLEHGGYVAEVRDLQSSGTELPTISRLRALFARTAAVPRLYQVGKAVEARVLGLLPQTARTEAYVVLALARPTAREAVGG